MILPPFRYVRAMSVDHALETLSAHPGSAALAGGQTMINALKLDLVSPSVLVDVHRLDALRAVAETDGELRVGSAMTYAELATDPVVALRVPVLAAVASGLVDRQVRNRGTIGGNCCLNDPASNFPPLLAALDARFVVRSAGEPAQTLDAGEFFLGSLLTRARGPCLLLAVHVPIPGEGTRVAYRHQQVGADSWALARAVVRVDLDEDGTVRRPRVVLGAVPGAPLRLTSVEAVLSGRKLTEETVAEALAAFDTAGVETRGDSHGSAAYRLAMARVQLARALSDVRTRPLPSEEVA